MIVVAAYDKNYAGRLINQLSGDILVMDTSEGGYDTGAYLQAYKMLPYEKEFLFLQDSLEALDPNVIEQFRVLQPKLGAVAWCQFTDGFDSQAQHDLGFDKYKSSYPGVGIFGPIFYTNRASLDKLKQLDLLPPVPQTKEEQQGCERYWAWAFHVAGMPVEAVSLHYDRASMEAGMHGPFKKHFPVRP